MRFVILMVTRIKGKPEGGEIVAGRNFSGPGFDTTKVPGGTMFCLCGQADDGHLSFLIN